MTSYKIWVPFVRVFHWALVAGFAANALFTDDESRQKALALPQSDVDAEKAVGLFAEFAMNTRRRGCEQKV